MPPLLQFLLWIVLGPAAAWGAGGTLLSETEARLDSLQAARGTIEAELGRLARREAGDLAELDRLEREQAATRSWLGALDQEHALLLRRGQELQRSLEAGQARLDSLVAEAAGHALERDSLAAEIRTLARRLFPLRRLDPWTWLLSAESAREGLRRLRGWPWVHEGLRRRLQAHAAAEGRLSALAEAQRGQQADLVSVRGALLAGQRRNAENRRDSEKGLQRLALAGEQRRAALEAIRGEQQGRAALARRLDEAGRQVGELLGALREQWRLRESGRESERRRLEELDDRLAAGALPPPLEAAPGDAPPATGEALTRRRGSLPRPVQGRLVRPHGLRTDPQLGTVLDNPGCDYAVAPGQAVRLVHAGRIERVVWVPGYGSTVLASHAGDGWTVYALLGSVEVREGQQLPAGTRLGLSAEAEDGAQAGFHFELWLGDQAQDPEAWFAP
jgi:septal ring factor EnvC (AmiA/AmiB activator)